MTLKGDHMTMTSQTEASKQKQRDIEQYIQETCLMSSPAIPLRFDLRKYAKFIEENQLSGEDITPRCYLNLFCSIYDLITYSYDLVLSKR